MHPRASLAKTCQGSAVRALRVLQQRSAAVTRDAVQRAVSQALATSDLAEAGRATFRETELAASRLGASAIQAPDCARGCSSCCHVHVDATAPEIEAVASYVRTRWSPSEIEALASRLGRAAGLSAEERWQAKIPCALLAEDQVCSIHEVRPLRCRAFHSLSVATCREAFAGRTDAAPPQSPALLRLYDAAEEGLTQALRAAGRPAGAMTLEEGLARALEPPCQERPPARSRAVS
jgi:Fe-S-cluster containining protein